jgi:hypothetical protein
MSLGYSQEPNIVNLSDTAELEANVYTRTDDPIIGDDIDSVSFLVEQPDGTQTTVTGTVDTDGTGRATFDDTTQTGHHTAMATFTLNSGVIKSTRCDFEVIDPFADIDPSTSYLVAIDAWEKFEDCFDSESDGPWLQDMTNKWFNQRKMENFIDDALMDINVQNPTTNLALTNFFNVNETPPAPNADLPVLTQGVVVQIIRHLIRSYTEQPNPVGAQIAWQDRRDYLQRWQSVLQIEQAQYLRLLALYKRRFLGLGSTATLVSTKAGRLTPAPMRTRMAGRGYW